MQTEKQPAVDATTGLIFVGDCRDALRSAAASGVKAQMCVTSPPYFGLRDYGHEGQIGLEQTPEEYIAAMVDVFRCVRDVLADDGVLWLNLGDSYFSGSGRARSRGTSGTEEQGSQESGSTFGSLDGVRKGVLWSRIQSTDGRRALELFAELLFQIRARMEELRGHLPSSGSSLPIPSELFLASIQDQAQTAVHAGEQFLVGLQSTNPESLPQLPGFQTQGAALSAFLSAMRSFAACVQQCARMASVSGEKPHGMAGNEGLCEELLRHIECTSGYCSLVAFWLNMGNIEPYCTMTYKPKDLIGIPWMLAFALRADGWYLRQDIIWHKPNPMPESVRDRCTKAHEYIFLLSKSERYFFDSDAMKEPAAAPPKPCGPKNDAMRKDSGRTGIVRGDGETRNRRSVWTVATRPYKGAHFATFPPALIEPCILAGSRPGDVVLDPFLGSGTTGLVAKAHGRSFVGCELNPDYVDLAKNRIGGDVATRTMPAAGSDPTGL